MTTVVETDIITDMEASRTPLAETRPRPPRFDSLEQEVFLNLWRTYDCLKSLEEEAFGQAGLSAQQYNTLRLLQSVYPGSMPTLLLGSRLISRAPDMTRLLDRLEQRDLLSRTRRPDNRRVVEVCITPQGLKLLEELRDSVEKCHLRQLGHLDVKSQRQLVKLLKAARQPHEDSENLSFVDE
ncbi:MAG TPA: MarR family transcriptional regulator [Planctomycetaceae bacterium]|nr:MarR family transcriptional regulator [Planctomycetaceae bacterium]